MTLPSLVGGLLALVLSFGALTPVSAAEKPVEAGLPSPFSGTIAFATESPFPADSITARYTLPIRRALLEPNSITRRDTLPGRDTVVTRDTIIVRDTVTIGSDTLPDGRVVPRDTILIDTFPPPPRLPDLPRPVPTGWSTGIWEWDREDLLGTRSMTLAELLSEVPGVLPLRGGDHGNPVTVTAFGVGGGRVRVFLDGFEMAPMEGATIDLSRIGLGGLERVRVDRHPGELRVELFSLTVPDPRPFTFIHVGTGDLNTNVIRGVFQHPRVLGGSLALGLDRVDTEGEDRTDPGTSSGGWVRYSINPTRRSGLGVELRRMTSSHRGTVYPPGELSRTDWLVRGRYTLMEGVFADAFGGRSSLDAEPPDVLPQSPEEVTPLLFESRSQLGLRLVAERALPIATPLALTSWGEGGIRLHDGAGWPEQVLNFRGGIRSERIGGVDVGWDRQSWVEDQTATETRVRTWSGRLFGFSAFGSWENGRRGMPLPALEQADPLPNLFTDRTALRVGGRFDVRSLFVGAAWVRMDADRLAPMGFAPERPGARVGEGERPRDGLMLPGGRRTGVELSAHVPLLDGLALTGSARFWDEDSVWRYLPQTSYDARLAYHNVFLPTRNLELWADAGVRERDAMAIPLPGDGTGPALDTSLQTVPFNQSWFLRLQVRVVTVRVFVDWENVTIRRNNQDFPGRILPSTRTMYGVRWTLWN